MFVYVFDFCPIKLDITHNTCVALLKKRSFARVIARYVFLVYVAMLYMNYPLCRDCAFSASFVRECTDVSL